MTSTSQPGHQANPGGINDQAVTDLSRLIARALTDAGWQPPDTTPQPTQRHILTTRELTELFRLARLRDREGVATVPTAVIAEHLGCHPNTVTWWLRHPPPGVGYLPTRRRDTAGRRHPTRRTSPTPSRPNTSDDS
jgi:hypothetical protein